MRRLNAHDNSCTTVEHAVSTTDLSTHCIIVYIYISVGFPQPCLKYMHFPTYFFLQQGLYIIATVDSMGRLFMHFLDVQLYRFCCSANCARACVRAWRVIMRLQNNTPTPNFPISLFLVRCAIYFGLEVICI